LDLFEKDCRELLAALNKYEAEFLIVGAHALAAHDLPRGTQDVDIWVGSTEANASRVYAALLEWGAATFGLTEADFGRHGPGLHIGVPPHRIDVMTWISGVEFSEAWPRSISKLAFGEHARYIGVIDLIRNKSATGRSKDKEDVERLRNRYPDQARVADAESTSD